LGEEAARRELSGTRWYEIAKKLAVKAKKKLRVKSTIDNWVNNRRKGSNYWPWEDSVQFVVQAVVGEEEEHWRPWKDRWEDIQGRGKRRKKSSSGRQDSDPSWKRWLKVAASVAGFIATVVSIVAGMILIFKQPSDGAVHSTTNSATARGESTCRGEDCMGKSPETLKCGTGAGVIHNEMLVDESYKGIVIQIKYSETCQALWAKITGGTVGDIVEIYNDDGDAQRDRVLEYDNKFTPMLPATSEMHVHACVTRKGVSPKCTPDVTVNVK
jgi:hypothetical protein